MITRLELITFCIHKSSSAYGKSPFYSVQHKRMQHRLIDDDEFLDQLEFEDGVYDDVDLRVIGSGLGIAVGPFREHSHKKLCNSGRGFYAHREEKAAGEGDRKVKAALMGNL